MRRRDFIAAIGGAAALPIAGRAQKPERMRRVGILDGVGGVRLARLAPDAIFVVASRALQAMRRATSDIPIVFANVGDPVAQGFVASLARPGGNITGFSSIGEFSVASKQLDLLKKLVPTLERVAFMYD